MTQRRFEGKTAIVTGAAGDIGAATAERLAREGADVVVFDRKEELLTDTTAACEAAGGKVLALAVDQTDRARVEEAVDEATTFSGRVDVLFANAGYGKFAPFLSIPQREWHRHVDVNLTGTFDVCQVVAQRMASDRRGGAIVVNASSGAVTHADQLGAYCATKSALRAMVFAMAAELGSHRIRVNAVLPGVVETGMTAPMLQDVRHRDVLLSETPVGRLGQPEDVAAAVCFLASDDAAFVNGVDLLVDGGQTIHGHSRWFRLDYRNAHEEQWQIPS
jgi:NAD(P)-dependent dehydrogenase (short-subunit alcohol dehydrogenase family)